MKKLVLIFTSICFFIILSFGCKKQDPKKDSVDELSQLFDASKANEQILTSEAAKLGPDVWTKLQLRQIIVSNGIPSAPGRVFDDFYVPCDSSFVFSRVSNAAFNFFVKDGVNYRSNTFDCDDFSIAAMVLAKREYLFLNKDNRPVNLTFGEFAYFVNGDPKRVHEVNLFITKDREVKFFEPQLQKIVQLSLEEKASCIYWRF